MIQTRQFTRKPFDVDAIQVTEENMKEVAEWCNGDIRSDKKKRKFIKVRVNRPMGEKQTQAYPGDWILYAGTGYKVYTDKAFESSFDPARTAESLEPSPK